VALLLSSAGYRTVVSQDDTHAFALILQEQPAVVILDLQMRQRDAGWEISEQLRADPRTAQIPVIVFSANHKLLQERRDLHADRLRKPFAPQDLMDMVAAVA
jgi:CheY-like chemotaxis protein